MNDAIERVLLGVEEVPAVVVPDLGDAVCAVFVRRIQPGCPCDQAGVAGQNYKVRRRILTAAAVIAVDSFDRIGTFLVCIPRWIRLVVRRLRAGASVVLVSSQLDIRDKIENRHCLFSIGHTRL